MIFFAGFVVSSLMVGIKRLHDRNKGDWWAVLFFIVPIALNGRINALPLTRRGGLSSRVSLLLPTAKFGIINIWAMAAIQR